MRARHPFTPAELAASSGIVPLTETVKIQAWRKMPLKRGIGYRGTFVGHIWLKLAGETVWCGHLVWWFYAAVVWVEETCAILPGARNARIGLGQEMLVN